MFIDILGQARITSCVDTLMVRVLMFGCECVRKISRCGANVLVRMGKG